MTSLATLLSVRNGLIGLSVQSTAPAVAAMAAQGVVANRILSGPALGLRRIWTSDTKAAPLAEAVPAAEDVIAEAVTEAAPVAAVPEPVPTPNPETPMAAPAAKKAKAVEPNRPAKDEKPKAAKAKGKAPKANPNGVKPGKPATMVYQSPSSSGKSGSVTLAAMPEPTSRKDIN